MLSSRGPHSALRGGMRMHGRAACKPSLLRPTVKQPPNRIRQFSAIPCSETKHTHLWSSTSSHLPRHRWYDNRIRPVPLSQTRFKSTAAASDPSSTLTATHASSPPFSNSLSDTTSSSMPTAAGSFSIETLRTDDAAAIDPDIYSLEEAAPAEIGYLREIYDLDFGWGPTSMMQYVFEHVHVYLGAEYWVSIMLTAAIVRLVIFPLQASAADNTAKMASLTPVTKPIQDRIKWAKEKKDQVEIKRCYTQLRTVWNQADVRVYRGFLPLLQLPLGFGLWRLFRNMGDVGVAGLESGGPLFHIPVLGDLGLENLLEPGPMYIAFLVAGMNFASAKLAGKERTITSDDTMLQAQKFMLYGLPVVSFFITLVQPALVQLFFLNTSFFAISSTWLLQQNRFRAFYGITPRVTPTSQADKQQEEVRKRKKYAGTINVRKDAKTLKAEKQKAEAEEAQKKQRRPLPRSPSIPQKVLFSAGSWVAVFDKLRVRLEDGDLPLFRSRETQEKRREERALKDWAKQREDYERENREKVERGMRERDEEGKRLRREARLRRSRG